MTRAASRRAQHGFTLIEVLVSILIFSFGLLGFAGLQARAIQFAVSAEDTNRAALLANDMAATMVAKNAVDPSGVAISADVTAWQARVAASPASGGLPNGTGTVTVSTPKLATLTVQWRAPSGSASAANDTNRYVTQVVLP